MTIQNIFSWESIPASKKPSRVFDIFKNTVHLSPDPLKRFPRNAIHLDDIKSCDIIRLHLPYREYYFLKCANIFPFQAQPSARTHAAAILCWSIRLRAERVRMQPQTAARYAIAHVGTRPQTHVNSTRAHCHQKFANVALIGC